MSCSQIQNLGAPPFQVGISRCDCRLLLVRENGRFGACSFIWALEKAVSDFVVLHTQEALNAEIFALYCYLQL
jgi:hypothetical protein